MKAAASKFVCHGCGAVVDIALQLPFACPRAAAGDDIDHVLTPEEEVGFQPDPRSPPDPFLRYRALLSPYRLARAAGLSEDAWAEFVGELGEALIEVDGGGFRITPMTKESRLAQAAGLAVDLWVKDETGNVAGSHKARHLMGVMLYLRVLAAGRLPAGQDLHARRLAIASCGNAALAAAVIARAAEWPIDVFIPPDAPASVVRRLKDLGATIAVCARRAGETGDPCVGAFRRAVQKGAIPFGVQGPDNGLAIEGGRTLAFEMADALRDENITPAAVFVQVGGGALASAVSQGFAVAAANGVIAQRPRLVTVQTAGCAPLARAWRESAGIDMRDAARRRSHFMWPWEATPASIAHGILDDETYDWWDVTKGMRETEGEPLVVGEDMLARAWELARAYTKVGVSATGTAGFAGLLQAGSENGPVVVIFSGAER
jgi:threonine synthase